MDRQVEQLKEYYDQSSSVVAITGAGISFSSGGLSFDHSSSEDMREMMVLGSEEALRNEPDRYYRQLDKAFLHSMFTYGPSPAHKALVQMEVEAAQ